VLSLAVEFTAAFVLVAAAVLLALGARAQAAATPARVPARA
jgi:hypothetical protein